MRISEERFRVALKSSPTVVFNQDLELRYTWINSPVLAWAGQDYIGKTDAEIVGGQDGVRLTAIKQGVLKDGNGARTEVAVTFQGETHYFDLTVEPLRNEQGTVVGITCAATDVTPLKRAALELERLNQLKTQVLGTIAHDLRNPISGILAITELLADEVATVLGAEQAGLLSDIRKSSEFMVQVIDDLLDLSSIESGALHLDCRIADLHKLLKRNVRLNARIAGRKHIEVALQIGGPLPKLSFDERKIEQVLNSLISNALKFSQPGTRVEVGASARDGFVRISIRNQGPGIPETELSKLSQPFGRASIRDSSSERSTGIDLLIAQKIVEGHGGMISFESQVGAGSMFIFTLPA